MSLSETGACSVYVIVVRLAVKSRVAVGERAVDILPLVGSGALVIRPSSFVISTQGRRRLSTTPHRTTLLHSAKVLREFEFVSDLGFRASHFLI